MERREFLHKLIAHGFGAAALGVVPQSVSTLMAEQVSRGAARTPIVGLNAHLLTPEGIQQLVDLGITHVRHTLYWPLWSRNDYPLGFAENVRQATRAGLRLTLVVHNWAGGAVVGSGVDRSLMRDFARFVAARAQQFPQVEAWQLWNEQDLWVQAPFGASTGIPMARRGRHFAEQLEIAYPLIKRANPRALVVTGGTAEHPNSGFLQGMVEQRPPVDAVAIHAYGDYRAFRDRVVAARQIVGDLAPIWVTEAGQDTSSDAEHLRVWRDVIEGNQRDRLVQRIYPYVLEAGPTEQGHGLVRSRNRTRPTYRWLRSHIRG